MIFLDFEKPLESLYEQLDKIRQVGEEGDLDVTPMIKELEGKIKAKRKEIYENLSGWQKVQLSRHPARPYTQYYIEQMCRKFVELHGDRHQALQRRELERHGQLRPGHARADHLSNGAMDLRQQLIARGALSFGGTGTRRRSPGC